MLTPVDPSSRAPYHACSHETGPKCFKSYFIHNEDNIFIYVSFYTQGYIQCFIYLTDDSIIFPLPEGNN